MMKIFRNRSSSWILFVTNMQMFPLFCVSVNVGVNRIVQDILLSELTFGIFTKSFKKRNVKYDPVTALGRHA